MGYPIGLAGNNRKKNIAIIRLKSNEKLKQKVESKRKRKVKKTAEEVNEDLKYLFGKINWGASNLDAKAITIMNEIPKDIRNLELEVAVG